MEHIPTCVRCIELKFEKHAAQIAATEKFLVLSLIFINLFKREEL
jgi:hypothetical protein